MKSVYILAVVFFCLGLSAPAQAADDLATRDWSVKASPSLEKNPPPPEEIRKFVNKLMNSDLNPILCSAKFVDIGHDGTYRLLASLDSGGRHFCNQLVIIAKQGSGFALLNQWKVWGVGDINAVLEDVDHDGREEVVLPQAWTIYDGASHCLAIWQKIFQWDNGKFVDRSNQFPDFYKKRREELKTGLDRNMGYGPDAVCEQMEMDKISRFLSIEPHAGFARAMDWAGGHDASLKRKAAAVFADIGNEESREALGKLATDEDPLVAETARLYMSGGQ